MNVKQNGQIRVLFVKTVALPQYFSEMLTLPTSYSVSLGAI